MTHSAESTDPEEPSSAVRIYRAHPDAVDELAGRDDRVGIVFGAIRDIAIEEDEQDAE